MDDRQRLGALALAVGVTLIGVGAAGALTDRSRGPATGVVASASPPAVSPHAPTPSPVADRAALVRSFFAELVTATRARDVESMVAWLHPAALERYGESACREFLASRNDPTFEVVVISVGEPESWPWTTDGVATTIEGGVAVAAQVTNAGDTVGRELHVALVEGEVRWFTDCGTPLRASPAP